MHGYKMGARGWETSKHQFALDGWHGGRIDARGGEDNISARPLPSLSASPSYCSLPSPSALLSRRPSHTHILSSQ